MGHEPSLGSEPALSNTTLNSSHGRSIHNPWPVPPATSRGQAQAVTTVPEQLCHLILDQATEAVIAAQGGHRRGHSPVFRVQRAEAEPRYPEVLQETGTVGSGQPFRRKPATPTSLPSHLPDTPKTSQEPTLLVAHITWVLWGSGSLQRAQRENRGNTDLRALTGWVGQITRWMDKPGFNANKGPSNQGYGFSSGHVWM